MNRLAGPELARTCTAFRGPSAPLPPVEETVKPDLTALPTRVAIVPARKKVTRLAKGRGEGKEMCRRAVTKAVAMPVGVSLECHVE